MTNETTDKPTIVVKIGGSTLGAHDTTLQDVVALQAQGTPPIVVHGGGAVVTQWLELHQIPTQFVRGLRVTDAQSLEVVTAVLAGLVNKELVASIQALGGRAIGMSGADGGFIQAEPADPDLGYVGRVTGIDLAPLQTVMSGGYIPVISTVALDPKITEGPRLLNCNADTVAGELAAVLNADTLVFLTDVPGIYDSNKAVIAHLSKERAEALLAEGTASGGMIPKIEACLRAREGNARSYIVDGREPHMLLGTLKDGGTSGTAVW